MSKELILIETTQSQQVKKLLEKAHISYKIYQEPIQKESIFAHYNQALKDKPREQEAQELENAEEEDIIDEE
jgi:hypothetical protein